MSKKQNSGGPRSTRPKVLKPETSGAQVSTPQASKSGLSEKISKTKKLASSLLNQAKTTPSKTKVTPAKPLTKPANAKSGSFAKPSDAKIAKNASVSARPGRTASTKASHKPLNIVKFFEEVRTEARKVTWTDWRETRITSVMVFIMVTITALFFLLIDGSLSFFIQLLPKIDALMTAGLRLLGLAG